MPISNPTTRTKVGLGTLLVVLGATASGCGGTGADPSPDAAETPAAVTTSAPADPAGAASSAAVEALLARYYDAYNAGDSDTVLGILSDVVVETPPGNIRFWIGVLEEQVSADCVPSPTNPATVRCIETYSDVLHGPAGATADAVFQYTERNGTLLQTMDGSSIQPPGCRAGRCPGEIAEVAGSQPLWTYEEIEAELFAWLEQTHPEVAAEIEDARRLHYLAGNTDAVLAVLPYVAEFVAANPDSAGYETTAGVDVSSMPLLDAVEAMYGAMNSHDAEAYEAFFGGPPGDVMEWFWEQGRRFDVSCEETESPEEVRCTGAVTDDFYTKAGAVFEFRELWTRAGDQLLPTNEWANSSAHWAYSEFEQDYARWMRASYPEDAAIAFPTSDLVHNGEAARIAVAHLNEFLDASDDYPRSPDGQDDGRGF